MKAKKQMKYWAKKMGIVPEGGSYARYNWNNSYFIGLDRRWRLVNGWFCCSCPLRYFERWANSHGSEIKHIPQNKKEFFNITNVLLEESKNKK